MSETIITTRDQITKVFEEWFRHYNEDPYNYMPAGYTDGDAGESADYFIQLLHKVN